MNIWISIHLFSLSKSLNYYLIIDKSYDKDNSLSFARQRLSLKQTQFAFPNVVVDLTKLFFHGIILLITYPTNPNQTQTQPTIY